jgi:HAD superfamily hydrolase (TIGR01549 family)
MTTADSFDVIKKTIDSPQCKLVSFDVFDTLVVRPFRHPFDLFYYTGLFAKHKKYVPLPFLYLLIRRNAENTARLHKKMQKQDVTLDEIYTEIKKKLNLSISQTKELEQEEINKELTFCTTRQEGKDLYNYAKTAGKYIIITSDMYLPADSIRAILEKNGFSGWNRIYVSSETGVTKASGDMFDYIIKQNRNIQPNNIIHIGDNALADKIKACEKTITAFCIPLNKNHSRLSQAQMFPWYIAFIASIQTFIFKIFNVVKASIVFFRI